VFTKLPSSLLLLLFPPSSPGSTVITSGGFCTVNVNKGTPTDSSNAPLITAAVKSETTFNNSTVCTSTDITDVLVELLPPVELVELLEGILATTPLGSTAKSTITLPRLTSAILMRSMLTPRSVARFAMKLAPLNSSSCISIFIVTATTGTTTNLYQLYSPPRTVTVTTRFWGFRELEPAGSDSVGFRSSKRCTSFQSPFREFDTKTRTALEP
jgi:hypothetical protein